MVPDRYLATGPCIPDRLTLPNRAGSAIILIVMEYLPQVKPQKIWQLKASFPALQHILARELGISLIAAQLLINRGIYTIEQGRAFFHSGLDRLPSPLLLQDMELAVRRLTRAVRAKEQILVYGDYDADGMTATALLVQVIRRLGGMVDYYIPNRLAQGYGLHLDILRQYREQGTSLVITVDCGISSLAEAAWARENGLDLIITDHHEPPPVLPQALAVINPKRPDCRYPFKDLAGVGVALKLAQALLEENGRTGQAWQDYLDLTCLGTIADIVPLHHENRILVKQGLNRLAQTARPGLKALLAVSGTGKNMLGTDEVGFRLAPRLNAAGRIGDPAQAVRLLLTEHAAEARSLADALHQGNIVRQDIEAKVLKESLAILEQQPEILEAKVIVLAAAGWHPGVIGIVASRLTERFYRPVLLIAVDGRTGRGSARSIPGFHLYQALSHCQDYLTTYGGHALAAGFSLPADNIEEFSREINCYAGTVLDRDKMTPRLYLDGLITLSQVTEKLVNEINLMEPFGINNPAPLLGCRQASVATCRSVGKEAAHLKMLLRSGAATVDGIGFNLGAYAELLATEETVDLAFAPGINEYNGRRSLQLEVKDVGLPAILDVATEKDFIGAYGVPAYHHDDLFIPEFIAAVINGTDCTQPPGHIEADREKSTKPLIVDQREAGERQVKLGELLAAEYPAVIVTTCAYQTIEIAYFLQLSYPALKGKVTCLHGALPEKQQAANAALYRTGAAQVLVTTPLPAGALHIETGCVIVYHLPYNRSVFDLIMRLVRPEGKVYLLFNTGDLTDNISWLTALAPDRNCLAGFYTMLRRQSNGSGTFILEPAQAVQSLKESGQPQVRACTVSTALQIFREIGLLDMVNLGTSIQITLFPVPREKQDLRNSQTYRRLHRIREEATAWMMQMFKKPLNNLY